MLPKLFYWIINQQLDPNYSKDSSVEGIRLPNATLCIKFDWQYGVGNRTFNNATTEKVFKPLNALWKEERLACLITLSLLTIPKRMRLIGMKDSKMMTTLQRHLADCQTCNCFFDVWRRQIRLIFSTYATSPNWDKCYSQ